MSPTACNIVALALAAGVLWGIHWLNSPRTAVKGNLLGAACMLGAIALTLTSQGTLGHGLLWLCMALGAAVGVVLALRVAMIQMPQLVALLNGLGGGASALVALVVLTGGGEGGDVASRLAAAAALVVGAVTLSGSGVAAGKLHRMLSQRPVVLRGHTSLSFCVLVLAVLGIGASTAAGGSAMWASLCTALAALCFGVIFTIRIGGADMPITISLLNSLSGVAASVAGLAIRNPLLVVVGAIVGTAGLVLTQLMCRAMNRSLVQVLTGRTTAAGPQRAAPGEGEERPCAEGEAGVQAAAPQSEAKPSVAALLGQANTVVIVPGYGMALAQAQGQVKALADALEARGKEVRFAIHPVAGRMPGHMNVLLAEVDVPYEKLCEMDDINQEFATTDLVIVVGANDVVNPAANTAEGTPIYGMPILRVSEAKHVLVCNLDTQPGYAGVDNPLYGYDRTTLVLGDAAQTVAELVEALGEPRPTGGE